MQACSPAVQGLLTPHDKCIGNCLLPFPLTYSFFYGLWCVFKRLAMELAPNRMTFLMSPRSIGDCHIGNANPSPPPAPGSPPEIG